MKIKIITTILSILMISQISLASKVPTVTAEQLGEQANRALYYLSHYCSQEIPKLLQPGAWIGETTSWWSTDGSFGYHYFVFEEGMFFQPIQIGTLSLTVTVIENPPADGSSHDANCAVIPILDEQPSP